MGLLLPCNVIVYEDGDDTLVAALDPATMVDLPTTRVWRMSHMTLDLG